MPAVVVASLLDPLPKRMVLAWILPHPVPPFPVGRMPVTSFARSMSEVATTPAVARRIPVRFEIERDPVWSAEVDAVPETLSVPVVVLFVKIAVDGVEAPMGVLSIVPPLIVRLLATCASVADPTRSEKLIPSVEVAKATTLPIAPVGFPRIEFAAT